MGSIDPDLPPAPQARAWRARFWTRLILGLVAGGLAAAFLISGVFVQREWLAFAGAALMGAYSAVNVRIAMQAKRRLRGL